MLDLNDVDLDALLGELLEPAPDILDADTSLADDDPGLRGVDDDARLVGAPLDLDFRNRRGPGEPAEVLADRGVFVQPGAIILFLVPAAVPRTRDTESQTNRMNLLAHYFLAPALAATFLRPRFAGLADSTAARRDVLVESAIEAPDRRFGFVFGAAVDTTMVTCDMRLRLKAARALAGGSRRSVETPRSA